MGQSSYCPLQSNLNNIERMFGAQAAGGQTSGGGLTGSSKVGGSKRLPSLQEDRPLKVRLADWMHNTDNYHFPLFR